MIYNLSCWGEGVGTVHSYCKQTVHLYCEQTVHFLKHIYIKILRDIKGGELELWTDSTLVL